MYHLEFGIAAIAKYVAKKALRRAADTEGSHFHSADGTFKPSLLDLLWMRRFVGILCSFPWLVTCPLVLIA